VFGAAEFIDLRSVPEILTLVNAEIFAELLRVRGDRGVGEGEDLGDGAVVCLDDVFGRTGVFVGKVEDVAEVGSAPRVDGLGIVADDHEIVLRGGEEVDELGLEGVGVLILVDEDPLELALVVLADPGILLQEPQRLDEEIIEVHRVGGLFFLLVSFVQFLDGDGEMFEVGVAAVEQVGDPDAGVGGEAEDVGEDFGFGKAHRLGVDLALADDGVHDLLLILSVHDGEAAFPAEEVGVAAEDAVADGVEGAAPEITRVVGDEFLDTVEHFPGGLVGKGEQENAAGADPVVEEVGDPVGEGTRFATAGSGDDEGRARGCGDGGELLFVQFDRVVDLRFRILRDSFDSVFTGHLRRSLAREHRSCASKKPNSRPIYIFLAAASAN